MLFLKDPGARLDYAVDWTAACGTGRTIAASSWHAAPEGEGGILIVDDAVEGAVARVWIEGGREGEVAQLVNRVTLSDGTVDERSVTIRVGER